MKVAVVSSEAIRGGVGLRLDAGPYAAPTLKVDREIAAAEKAVATAQARLRRLRVKRRRILEEAP